MENRFLLGIGVSKLNQLWTIGTGEGMGEEKKKKRERFREYGSNVRWKG